MESTAGKPMTLKEILIDICKMLGEIDVPASKIEQIGIPIARSINGIQVCIKAMEHAENEEPKFTLERVDSIPEKEGEETNA